MDSVLAKPAILWSASLYLVLVVAVGIWAARRTRTAKDFFIAGQSLGLLVTGLATMSAAFSGFVFLGGPGLTYRMGVASLFICLPVSFTAGLLCWVVAKPLRLLSEVREVFTVPDAILARFDSRTASGLSALAVLLGTIAYLGAQLQALGVLIEAIFPLEAGLDRLGFGGDPLVVAMAMGVVVIVFYAVAGGMVAGVYTDLFQGLLMITAAAAVFYYALASGGGLESVSRSIVSSESFGPSFLDPLGRVPLFTAIGFFFVFAVGNLGQPHMLHKFYMLEDPRKLKWMPLVVGTSQMMCVLIWMGIGLAVPALVAQGKLPPLADPDQASPLFLLHFAPEILAGLVFAGILAAIMSTADSFVNIGSAALVRDLPRAFGRDPGGELLWGRVAVAGIAVLSAFFAWAYGDLIALLGTFAFSTFAAALTPALAIGLNCKWVSARAATASIATGLVLNLVLEFLARQTFFAGLPQPPLVPGALAGGVSMATSFALLIFLSWLDRGRAAPPAPDVAAVMDV